MLALVKFALFIILQIFIQMLIQYIVVECTDYFRSEACDIKLNHVHDVSYGSGGPRGRVVKVAEFQRS